jgi:tetratricopeptide (TPR) repeat protein
MSLIKIVASRVTGGLAFRLQDLNDINTMSKTLLKGLDLARDGKHLMAIGFYEKLLFPGRKGNSDVVMAKSVSLQCLAEDMLAKGDDAKKYLDEADETFADHIIAAHNDPDIWYGWGKNHLIAGNTSKAVDCFSRALQQGIDPCEGFICKAVIAAYEKEHTHALDMFEQARQNFVFFNGALNRLFAKEQVFQALFFIRTGSYAEAKDLVSKAEKNCSCMDDEGRETLATVYKHLAEYDQNQGNINSAILYFNKALLKDTTEQFRKKVVIKLGGAIHESLINILDLIDSYNSKGKMNISDPKYLSNLEQAFMRIDQMKNLQPSTFETREMLAKMLTYLGAHFLFKTGEFERALNICNDAVEATQNGRPVYPAVYGKAECLIVLHRYNEAIAFLDEFGRKVKDDVTMLHYMGQAYIGVERYEDAFAVFSKLVKLRKDLNGTAYMRLGDIFFIRAKFKEAHEQYSLAIQLEGTPGTSVSQYSQCMIDYMEKNYVSAQKHLEAYLDLFPKGFDVNAENLLIDIKLRIGQDLT